MFPTVSFPSSRLRGVINRLVKSSEELHQKGGDLNTFLQEKVDLDFLSLFAQNWSE